MAEAQTAPAPVAATAAPDAAGALDAAIAKAVAMTGDEGVDEGEAAKPEAKAKKAGRKDAELKEKFLETAADAKAEEAEPAPPAADLNAKARYHLQHGDVGKAIEAAFGDLSALGTGVPDAVREVLARKLGVGSKNWEQLRKHEAGMKRQLAAKEQQVSQLVDQVRKEYGHLHEAKALYEKGEHEAAFKLAFGDDLSDFQRKAISARVGKDPEVERLKSELERDRAERRAEREQYEQAQRQQHEHAQIAQYQSQLQGELSSSDDAMIARFAERPQFVARVFEVLRANYDAETGMTVPTSVAADYVRNEIQASLQQWQLDNPGQSPALTVQPGAKAEKPPVRPRATLKQSGAAEANGAPRKLSGEELRLKYQRQMESLPAER